jgi:hypothetical protein
MHTRDLIKKGEKIEKLALVQASAEAGNVFDERERAALAWAETVTAYGKSGNRGMIQQDLFERCFCYAPPWGSPGVIFLSSETRNCGSHIAQFGGKVRAHNVQKFGAEDRSAGRELRKMPQVPFGESCATASHDLHRAG